MKQESLISVVMPVYNGGKYLREAIESILNQTYQNFEFLIINDGSTDESEVIIQSYTDPRIVYFKNDRNRGLVYTLNYGISVAKGEYIARMDADDISESKRFEKQIDYFKNNPELGVCGTWAQIIGSNEVIEPETEDERIKCGLFFSNQFIHSSIMFCKAKLIKSRLKYEEEDFTAEDYSLWIGLSKSVSMANIPEYLLKYRIHLSQISTASSVQQIKKTNELRVLQIEQFLKYEPTEIEQQTHLIFLNNEYEIPSSSYLRNIHEWIRKLKDLNSKCDYYNTVIFNETINNHLCKRLLFQNHNNNNPLFLFYFYFFYFRNSYKFNLNFHIKFIIKCLTFYNPA